MGAPTEGLLSRWSVVIAGENGGGQGDGWGRERRGGGGGKKERERERRGEGGEDGANAAAVRLDNKQAACGRQMPDSDIEWYRIV
jgi:hypothetical protein